MFKYTTKLIMSMLILALFFSFAQASEILTPGKPGIYNIGENTARISFKDHSSNEIEFKIYNNKTDLLQVLSTKTTLGTGFQYTNLENLTACTVYSLTIIASNSTDDSNISQRGQFKTTCPTVQPPACTDPINNPVNLGVYHISTTTADFSFLDKSTNETGFRVYDNGVLIKTIASTSPETMNKYQYSSFTNLQAGALHSLKVEAYNADCTSRKSVKRNFKTLPEVGQHIAPTVNAGVDKSIQPGDTIELIGTATDDVAIDTNSYEWRDSNNTLVATTASFNYTAVAEGNFTFTFSAMDNEQLRSSDSITIEVKSTIVVPPQEISLCNNKSAYINTLYSLGMNINSTTAHGSVFSKNNNFVGAVICGEFNNVSSSSDVLNALKSSAFPMGTTVISNNGADGSIKVQYGVSNANTQAYAQLKSILEAVGETDFSSYIDYNSFVSIQNLYIDIYINFINTSEVYIIMAVSNQNDNNVDDLNALINGGIIGASNVQNSKTDSFTYQTNTLKADILFVMDDSGSMSDEQSAASSAIITTFGTAMSTNAVDWKATVIGTERSRSYLTKYIDDPSENNITKLATQLLLGTNGYDEVGLLKAYTYLSNGDITVRANSKLSIVYISDEIAHTGLSELGGISDINDSYFVQNDIKFNVIIPDFLSNSGNLAYEMADKTGAEVANIYNYSNGYNAMMQKIADEAAGSASQIILTETPIIASIQVSINGTVTTSGWTYNSSSNSVVFDALSRPNNGDIVTIAYNY
jgi:hypothetical protein